jgi:hypothetical protein
MGKNSPNLVTLFSSDHLQLSILSLTPENFFRDDAHDPISGRHIFLQLL